jgi:ATP adenylyltransferase
VIAIINGTHILTLNAFPVYRPQYLVLSLDSFRRQDEPLDREMLDATWGVLERSPSPMYAMYNGGNQAGCSRNHKHVQILPMPKPEDGFSFFPDRKDGHTRVPYVHFIHHFEDSCIPGYQGENLHTNYLRLLQLSRQSMGIAEDDAKTLCPHNVILVKHWMVVIPRGNREYNGVTANAAAMMGKVVTTEEAVVKKWVDSGPATVLSQLGIAVDRN